MTSANGNNIASINALGNNVTQVTVDGDVVWSAESDPIPSDYTHHWPVNEGSGTTIGDTGASNADATLTSGTWLTDSGFWDDTAVSFDAASSDYATAGNTANFTSGFSVYAQVRLDTAPAHAAIVSKGRSNSGGSTSAQWWLGTGGDGAWRFGVTNSSGVEATAGMLNSANMQTGVITDVVGTLSASGVDISINGAGQQLNSGVTSASTLNHTTHPVTFGRDNQRASLYMDGDIGRVALYDRALTDAEIDAISA